MKKIYFLTAFLLSSSFAQDGFFAKMSEKEEEEIKSALSKNEEFSSTVDPLFKIMRLIETKNATESEVKKALVAAISLSNIIRNSNIEEEQKSEFVKILFDHVTDVFSENRKLYNEFFPMILGEKRKEMPKKQIQLLSTNDLEESQQKMHLPLPKQMQKRNSSIKHAVVQNKGPIVAEGSIWSRDSGTRKVVDDLGNQFFIVGNPSDGNCFDYSSGLAEIMMADNPNVQQEVLIKTKGEVKNLRETQLEKVTKLIREAFINEIINAINNDNQDVIDAMTDELAASLLAYNMEDSNNRRQFSDSINDFLYNINYNGLVDDAVILKKELKGYVDKKTMLLDYINETYQASNAWITLPPMVRDAQYKMGSIVDVISILHPNHVFYIYGHTQKNNSGPIQRTHTIGQLGPNSIVHYILFSGGNHFERLDPINPKNP